MMTPYEKFRSLPDAENHLKPGMTLEKLDAIAAECSDNEAAQKLNEVRAKLFQLNHPRQSRGLIIVSPSKGRIRESPKGRLTFPKA
jgi:hypothetical protein